MTPTGISVSADVLPGALDPPLPDELHALVSAASVKTTPAIAA
jgi:hypothetical protein